MLSFASLASPLRCVLPPGGAFSATCVFQNGAFPSFFVFFSVFGRFFSPESLAVRLDVRTFASAFASGTGFPPSARGEARSLRDFHNVTGSTRVQALAYNAWVCLTNRRIRPLFGGEDRLQVRYGVLAIRFFVVDVSAWTEKCEYITMKSLILAQDER